MRIETSMTVSTDAHRGDTDGDGALESRSIQPLHWLSESEGGLDLPNNPQIITLFGQKTRNPNSKANQYVFFK